MLYVNGFMIQRQSGRVLLIQKNRPEFQAGKWNGIGGKIEPNETPRQAMVREFWEETGVRTGELDWELTIQMSGEGDEAGPQEKRLPFTVFYFRTFVDKFPAYHTTTDEHVGTHYADEVYRWPCLDNMKWILPLQFSPAIVFPLILQWRRPN